MERVKYRACDFSITYADLDGVENYMSKEELKEFRTKMNDIIGNTLGIENVQTRALMEKMFKLGYMAAHVIPYSNNLNDYETLR